MGLFGFGKKEEMPSSNEAKYGKAWLMIAGKKKDQGLQVMRELSNAGFHEATIALSMFASSMDERFALVKKAAEAGNIEGMWEYVAMSPHSRIPDRSNNQDLAWETICTKAAEAGSVDAMNELGNIFNRRDQYAESMYWYAMASANEHPQGQISMQGIAQKWANNGASKEYVKTSEKFTESRFKAALAYLEMCAGMKMTSSVDEMIELTLSGESLAGYFAGEAFESAGNLEMAYKMYNALCFVNDAHAMRCCADMLMQGRGTDSDPNAAFGMYMKAAKLGNRTAMFIAGEFTKKTDPNMAAYWYGLAHTRGYEHAITRLIQLAGN